MGFFKTKLCSKNHSEYATKFWLNQRNHFKGNQKFFSKDFDNLLFNLNEQARKLMFLSEIPKNMLETITVLIVSSLIFFFFSFMIIIFLI